MCQRGENVGKCSWPILMADLPSLLETLRWRADLVLDGRLVGRTGAELHGGVLCPQHPQVFDQGPVHCSIPSLPPQDPHGQGAAFQPGQDETCLGFMQSEHRQTKGNLRGFNVVQSFLLASCEACLSSYFQLFRLIRAGVSKLWINF